MAGHAHISKSVRHELESIVRMEMNTMLLALEHKVFAAMNEGQIFVNPPIQDSGRKDSQRHSGREDAPKTSPKQPTSAHGPPDSNPKRQLSRQLGETPSLGGYLSLLPQDGEQPNSARDVYKAVATAMPEEAAADPADKPSTRNMDVTVLVMLVVNGAADAYEVDCQARILNNDLPSWYKLVQLVLCVVFVFELFRRIQIKGRDFFTSRHLWHYFQIALLMVQCVETMFILREMVFGLHLTMGIKRVFRTVSMIRILRVFNILDHLDFTTELHLLLASMHGSLWSLLWSALFMIIPMFVFGMMLTQTVAEFRISSDIELDNSNVESDNYKGLMLYFGSLDSSMLSLFWSISGGLSWSEAMIPLQHYGFHWSSALFVCYVASMVFAVLNVLTGVFVNSATAASSSEKEKRILRSLQNIFCAADCDGSGNLTYSEFVELMHHKDMSVCLQSLNIPPASGPHLFKLIDADQSGVVEIDEFLQGCDRLQGSLKAIDFATFSVDFSTWKQEVQDFMANMEGHMRQTSGNSDVAQQGLLGRSLCMMPSFSAR